MNKQPEILVRWNCGDYKYFTGRDQYGLSGIMVFDNLEIIYNSIIKFLEYAYEHDIRLITDTTYGTIGALRSDRTVSFQFAMVFDDVERVETGEAYSADQLLNHTVQAYTLPSDIGYDNYISLLIMCEHETDVIGSVTKVILGNVYYIEYDMNNARTHSTMSARLSAVINNLKSYVRKNEGLYAWLLLQGITVFN